LNTDYSNIWEGKPFSKMLAEKVPAFALEHHRLNYWQKLREIASSDSNLRKTMPDASSGLISSPFTLRRHPFALHYSFSYMVHNSISYGVRPR
jgi:hypothetical protein